MKKQIDNHNWKSIIWATFALFYDSIIFFLFLNHDLNLSFLILLHFLLIAFLLGFIYHSVNRQEDLRYPILLALAVFSTGPFGAAGFILQALLYPLFCKFSTPTAVWIEQLFPEEDISAFNKIFRRVRSGWDDYYRTTEVSSFQDIFSYGTLSQKQAVLDAIVKDFHPEYSHVLKRALNDHQNVIRIQAGAIESKIDFDFNKQLMKLLEEKKEKPDSVAMTLNLANHYENYCSLGFLDNVRKKELGARAILYYREYLESNPADQLIWFSIGKLLYHMEDFSGYIEWYEQFSKQRKNIPEILQAWHQEALYRLHRYDELSIKKGAFE